MCLLHDHKVCVCVPLHPVTVGVCMALYSNVGVCMCASIPKRGYVSVWLYNPSLVCVCVCVYAAALATLGAASA